MSGRALLLLALVAAVLSVPLALSGRRVQAARQRIEATRVSLDVASRDATRVIELRSMAERVAEQRRPDDAVIPLVNAALDAIGVPRTRFGGLRTVTDAPLPGSSSGGTFYHEQTLRLSLRRLTVPQLGGLLEDWKASQELWTPTRIELAHVRGQDDPPLYDVTMHITAIYIAD